MADSRDEMIASLKEGICTVDFTNVNADKRHMECTLNEEEIAKYDESKRDFTAEMSDTLDEKTRERKVNLNVIPVFDINARDWRSFRVDSVSTFEKGQA